MVREFDDLDGALSLWRRRPQGLSGLPAAHAFMSMNMERHKKRMPSSTIIWPRARRRKPRRSRPSTTSISPFSISRKNSTSRPSTASSRRRSLPRRLHLYGPAGQSRRDPEDRAAHRRGRPRRYLRTRQTAAAHDLLQFTASASEAAPSAGQCWALWRVQRAALE